METILIRLIRMVDYDILALGRPMTSSPFVRNAIRLSSPPPRRQRWHVH